MINDEIGLNISSPHKYKFTVKFPENTLARAWIFADY